MRYTLQSHGRIVGHTDLDVHTVTPTLRQGFVEPTEEGRSLLADATSVWRAIAEVKRDTRARGEPSPQDHALVLAAMERRERLHLELRDEDGTPVQCDFIRITDIFDLNNGVVDEMCDTEEEVEASFQIYLSSLSDAARAEALAHRAELNASVQEDIEALLAEIHEDQEQQELYGSSYPPSPPDDPRWDTMQYLLQVFLEAPAWEKEILPDLQLPD